MSRGTGAALTDTDGPGRTARRGLAVAVEQVDRRVERGVPVRGGDAPNQGITAAGQCMYEIAHTVVSALGCSPALGFVHSGNERSFVVDVADLYKTDVAIPAAFDAAAEGEEDVASRTRRALRDRINETGLLNRCVRDIKQLLSYDGTREAIEVRGQMILQSDSGLHVPSGRNYGDEPIW